jgi:glycine/D-amino acid oxidase-like deaminating enzyme
MTVAPRVLVVGAGAFGGWTALELVRRGARVTLIDAWGPGHARSSSGGETRVIRAGYGGRSIYTRMAARALERWRDHDARFGRRFFQPIGALWMCANEDFGHASIAAIQDATLPVEPLDVSEARRRYPQIAFDGVSSVFLEPTAGLLLARQACQHVVERVVAEGGEYRCAAVESPVRVDDALERLTLTSGETMSADAFVFACGPWLPTLLPDVLGTVVRSTRQEIYYFGTPAGDPMFTEAALPVWLEVGERLLYGIPGNLHRGFKIADDSRGEAFDPESGSRLVTEAGVEAIRRLLARRFPALADAPCIGAEVCQYESTPDAHFIVDRHPAAPNAWILGGGSGHGFKMGPAIGEIAAAAILGDVTPDPTLALSRQGWRPTANG